MSIETCLITKYTWTVGAGVSFLPVLGSIVLYRSGSAVHFFSLSLMNEHMGSQVSRSIAGLWTKGTGEYTFWLLALVCVLLPCSSDCLMCRHGCLLTRLIGGRVGVVFMQSMLTAMRLHVLGKSEFFTALRAAEGLLACVQILMLMQEAAVLEGLTANIALVRPHVLCVLTTVVFHNGVVFEYHATLGAFVGFQGSVTSLVEAQGHTVREVLIALLACKDALQGVGLHVLGD